MVCKKVSYYPIIPFCLLQVSRSIACRRFLNNEIGTDKKGLKFKVLLCFINNIDFDGQNTHVFLLTPEHGCIHQSMAVSTIAWLYPPEHGCIQGNWYTSQYLLSCWEAFLFFTTKWWYLWNGTWHWSRLHLPKAD